MIAIRKDDDFEIRRFSSWLKVLTRQELVHFETLGAPRSPYSEENLEQNSKIVKVFLCFLGVGYRSLLEKVLKWLIRSSISFGRTDEKSNGFP
jgi:hypothetical protein